MTKERVMELTDTVIDVAMNRDGFTDRERINDLYKIGFEYVDEICKVMPPVTDATLPFVPICFTIEIHYMPCAACKDFLYIVFIVATP